ncbi:MAG: WecB/TagA/CpsF family glycosyltransferase [Chloroflexota bacterium]
MDGVRARVNLLHTDIDNVDIEEAVERIDTFVRSGRPHQIITVNLDFLRLGVKDTSFRKLMNSADMAVADGMPLVRASRLVGEPLPERVAGIDLVCECAGLAAQRGYRMFLLGAAPGVADTAAAILRERYPDLQIAGTYSPPSSGVEHKDEILARIHAARPDMLLVAFGAPRQDWWIREHMAELNVPVCVGVGGSFDMLAGRVSRAPMWMQRSGMEWLHRFRMEPGRLWKRYFMQDLPVFVRLMVRSSVGSSQAALPVRIGGSVAERAATDSTVPGESLPRTIVS